MEDIHQLSQRSRHLPIGYTVRLVTRAGRSRQERVGECRPALALQCVSVNCQSCGDMRDPIRKQPLRLSVNDSDWLKVLPFPKDMENPACPIEPEMGRQNR